jgi:uncharacterized protein (TIGR03435 family)
MTGYRSEILRLRGWCLAFLLVSLAGGTSEGQLADAAAFEFVSIRRNTTTTDTHVVRVLPGGRFEARRAQLIGLVRFAYGFDHLDPQLIDGQSWMYQEYFDVLAANGRDWSIAPGAGVHPPELRPMLRTLLEERFGLRTRVEEKEVRVYALRRIHELPGPNLRRSGDVCRGVHAPPDPGNGLDPCPFVRRPGVLQMGGSTMADFARTLSTGYPAISLLVQDQTGLEGLWDLEVTFTPQGQRARPEAPPLPAAIEQQLGLRLERTQAPVERLVVERARRPVED